MGKFSRTPAMLSQIEVETVDSLLKLVRSYPAHRSYQSGNPIPIPSPEESQLIESEFKNLSLSVKVADSLREKMSKKDASSLTIFAVRVAIYAVRHNRGEILKSTAWAICLDDDLDDWRSVLVALSLMEDASVKLKLNFSDVIEPWLFLAQSHRLDTIKQGYLSRAAEMRDIRVMGYTVADHGDGLFDYIR